MTTPAGDGQTPHRARNLFDGIDLAFNTMKVCLGSKVPVHEWGQLRPESGVMRTKIGAKPTSANECPKLGPIQTCRGDGSDGKF